MNKDTANNILTIIVILNYIVTALVLGTGLYFIWSAITSPSPSFLGTGGPGLFVFMGALISIFGVLFFWIVYKFMKKNNWARIVLIVCSTLSFLSGLGNLRITILFSIINLVISGTTIYFIAFNKSVVALFTEKK